MPAVRPRGSRCPSCSWPWPPSWRRSARASPGRLCGSGRWTRTGWTSRAASPASRPLLPDQVAPRPAGEHPRGGLRARPVRGQRGLLAVRALHHHQPVRHALRHHLAAPGERRRAGHRRPSVRLPGRQLDPLALPGDARPDPAGVDPAGTHGLWAVPKDGRLPRPVLHGRGLHAARDEEHRPVRTAVRHYLVRQRAGDGGCPGGGVRRSGGVAARGDPPTRPCFTPACWSRWV